MSRFPNDPFARADALARRPGVSRSRIYAEALSEYLAARERRDVTTALDEIHSGEPSALDPALAALQARSVATGEEW